MTNDSKGETQNEGDKDLDDRLQKLRAKLEGPEGSHLADRADPDAAAERKRGKGDISKALKVSSEFIAGILVGGGLGYAFDVLLGTSPWGLVVFLLLGFCAATLNVMRSAGFVAENEIRLKDTKDD